MPYLQKNKNLADIKNPALARAALQLGTYATTIPENSVISNLKIDTVVHMQPDPLKRFLVINENYEVVPNEHYITSWLVAAPEQNQLSVHNFENDTNLVLRSNLNQIAFSADFEHIKNKPTQSTILNTIEFLDPALANISNPVEARAHLGINTISLYDTTYFECPCPLKTSNIFLSTSINPGQLAVTSNGLFSSVPSSNYEASEQAYGMIRAHDTFPSPASNDAYTYIVIKNKLDQIVSSSSIFLRFQLVLNETSNLLSSNIDIFVNSNFDNITPSTVKQTLGIGQLAVYNYGSEHTLDLQIMNANLICNSITLLSHLSTQQSGDLMMVLVEDTRTYLSNIDLLTMSNAQVLTDGSVLPIIDGDEPSFLPGNCKIVSSRNSLNATDFPLTKYSLPSELYDIFVVNHNIVTSDYKKLSTQCKVNVDIQLRENPLLDFTDDINTKFLINRNNNLNDVMNARHKISNVDLNVLDLRELAWSADYNDLKTKPSRLEQFKNTKNYIQAFRGLREIKEFASSVRSTLRIRSAALCDVNEIDTMVGSSLLTSTVTTNNLRFSPIMANINMSVANGINPVVLAIKSDLSAQWKILDTWTAPPNVSLPILQNSLDDNRANAVLTYKYLKDFVDNFNHQMTNIYSQLTPFGSYTYNEIRL